MNEWMNEWILILLPYFCSLEMWGCEVATVVRLSYPFLSLPISWPWFHIRQTETICRARQTQLKRHPVLFLPRLPPQHLPRIGAWHLLSIFSIFYNGISAMWLESAFLYTWVRARITWSTFPRLTLFPPSISLPLHRGDSQGKCIGWEFAWHSKYWFQEVIVRWDESRGRLLYRW
jgi:hypothetical protein